LSAEEFEEIKRHPEIGYRILCAVKEMADIAEFVLYHHEKWDGTGYPKGLKAEQIPLMSRITSIADAYDAMTSERSYHDTYSKETAKKELLQKSGTQFDPELVKVFLDKVIGDF
jgi:HD-GYP domain-containing protein (c-di-GMP phosphodiesterase class II)